MIPVIARLDNRDLGSVMNDLKREIQSQVNLPQGYHITYGLFVTNTPLNVGSYTGIIMIIGIIGENAIFTFLQFEQARKKTTTDGAIVYAISTRLRPKLMTALGAISALSHCAGYWRWCPAPPATGNCGNWRLHHYTSIVADCLPFDVTDNI
jgi:Cu/Ag efflux pump CusA